MVTDAGAAPDDVRTAIDTDLDDEALIDILEVVERDVDRAYGSDASAFTDTDHRADLEAAVAAHRVGTVRDPRAESESLESASVTYAADQIGALEDRIRRLDPGDAFSRHGIIRDTDRYTSST